MMLETVRFGKIEIDGEKIIYFPAGIYGFEEYHNFILIKIDPSGLMYCLQSTENPDLSLCLVNSFAAMPDYDPEVDEEEIADLETSNPEDIIVLSVAVIPKNIEDTTVNCTAPIFINYNKKIGKQHILSTGEYSVRYKVFEHLKKYASEEGGKI